MNENEVLHLDNLLKDLSELAKNVYKKNNQKEGFNIFRTLHKEHDEVRLHSRFLSFLLSPDGSHGKEDLFLNKFLEENDLKNFINVKNIKVYPTEKEKIEHQNIDILIINEVTKKAIIIENKIHAGDSITESGGQIERYIEIVIAKGFELENIYVLYLTLEGHNPSPLSLGKFKTCEKLNLKEISYKVNVNKWLENCKNEIDHNCKNETYDNFQNEIDDNFQKECINQYLNIIKKLTNYIDMEDLTTLSKQISESKENLLSAKLLLDNAYGLKLFAIQSFWKELEAKLRDEGFETPSEFEVKNIYMAFDLNFKKGDSEFYIYHANEMNEILYWGFYSNNSNKKEFLNFERIEDKNRPYFRKYFKIESQNLVLKETELPNQEEYIYLQDFTKENTFSLISATYRKQIVDKLVNEIDETVKQLNL